MPRSEFVVAVALILITACAPPGDAAARGGVAERTGRDSALKDSIARARQDSVNRTLPGYVVDSIFPVEEQVRRFKATVGGTPVTELQHASASRDELVHEFIRAVSARDSTALRALAVNSREFIDLVYPESPSTHPPYQQDPSLVWRMIQNPSGTGLTRLLRREAGVELKLAAYSCDAKPARQGRNLFWSNCALRLIGAKGDTSTHRLFGTIIERNGRLKFMSYKNEF